MSEWEAFNRIQPIGKRRLDVYFSQFMVTIHNIALGFSGAKNAKKFKVEEFIPNWSGIKESEPDMTPEQIKQFWIAFAEKQNKKVLEEQERATTKRSKQ